MSLAVALLVSLTLAQPTLVPPAAGAPVAGSDAAFPADARVSRDAASGLVRQVSGLHVAVADPTLAGLAKAFFVPFRAQLGVDPAELVEVKREAWNGGTSVVLQRMVDGHEVIDGVVRVTLGRDGAVQACTSGDLSPVKRPTTPLIDVAEAVTAARQVLTTLGEPGSSDLVYLGGKLAWRLRFPPYVARPASPSGPAYAPIAFVDAATGELLALRNGLVR